MLRPYMKEKNVAVIKDGVQIAATTMHSPADWMKCSREEIMDMTLCTLPLPGSHDAGSYGAIRTRSRAQEKSVTEQLGAGVRYFDFRVVVDGKVYFSHHGHDHSRDNPYVDAKTRDTLLVQIKTFCENHDGEIVILSFADFKQVTGGADKAADKNQIVEFVDKLSEVFGSLLIPNKHYLSRHADDLAEFPIPTYRTCMDAGQRILAILDDELQSYWVWNKKDWVVDHFSKYNSATDRTWERLSELTIEDQKKYLAENRNLERFCITQAILDYRNELGTTTDNKKKIANSRNYAGAERMNPMFIKAYREWWAKETAVVDKKSGKLLRPNILLMDFVGEFDDFSATCESLIKQL